MTGQFPELRRRLILEALERAPDGGPPADRLQGLVEQVDQQPTGAGITRHRKPPADRV